MARRHGHHVFNRYLNGNHRAPSSTCGVVFVGGAGSSGVVVIVVAVAAAAVMMGWWSWGIVTGGADD